MKSKEKRIISERNNKSITFEIYYEDKTITIERDEDWNINITSLGKALNKKWKDWYKYHKRKVKDIEIQSGVKQIVKATRGRYGSTWVAYETATLVLYRWNHAVAYQLHFSNESYVTYLKKRIIKLELIIENQKKQKRRHLIGKGACIYCYTTNRLRKIGFTRNIDQRIKSHETSVGDFVLDWIFFLENAKKVEDAINDRFLYPNDRPKNNRDHFLTSAKKLRRFVISYLKLMKYSYREGVYQETSELRKKLEVSKILLTKAEKKLLEPALFDRSFSL